MRKMSLIIVGVLCFILGVCYLLYYDYLPPRTPLKIARVQSGLNISDKICIMDFKEEYSFTGEGYVYILLKMDKKNMEIIEQECIKNNYKKLTVQNLVNDKLLDSNNHDYGIMIEGRVLTSVKNGYYKLKNNNLQNMDFSITVFDAWKKELIVYISIP